MKSDATNFERIMRGLGEVADIAEGRASPARLYAPKAVDVKAFRGRTGLSQTAFPARFGFSVATLKDWEQGRSTPVAASKLFLVLIDKEPEAVERALRLNVEARVGNAEELLAEHV